MNKKIVIIAVLISGMCITHAAPLTIINDLAGAATVRVVSDYQMDENNYFVRDEHEDVVGFLHGSQHLNTQQQFVLHCPHGESYAVDFLYNTIKFTHLIFLEEAGRQVLLSTLFGQGEDENDDDTDEDSGDDSDNDDPQGGDERGMGQHDVGGHYEAIQAAPAA